MFFFFLFFFFPRENFSTTTKNSKNNKTGGFKKESDAARAYDVAALACRGPSRALTNFPAEEYLGEIAALAEAAGIPLLSTTGSPPSSSSSSAAAAAAGLPHPTPPPPLSLDVLPLLPHDLVVAHVRRRSTAFARGRSPFRGVSGEEGRWEARIGALQGKKNVSLKKVIFFFLFSLFFFGSCLTLFGLSKKKQIGLPRGLRLRGRRRQGV